MIPGWPNGATRPSLRTVITPLGVRRTQGTETSQYLEEEKTIVIPKVVASERGKAQTAGSNSIGVVGLFQGVAREVTKSVHI